MRYAVFGFLVFATACGGAAPTAPTSSLSQIGGGVATTEAKGGSDLPFKGTYEGLEKVDATMPSHHSLVDVTGTATHLGRFTVTADWTLGPTGGVGTSTWTAANGDRPICQRVRHVHGRTDPRPLDAVQQFRHDRRND